MALMKEKAISDRLSKPLRVSEKQMGREVSNTMSKVENEVMRMVNLPHRYEC